MPAQLQQTQGWSSSVPGALPLIAVSTSEVRRRKRAVPIPQGEPPQHEPARCLRTVAICRDMQVVNVGRGGTPQLHLSDVVGDGITHRHQEPGNRSTHGVTLSIHRFGPRSRALEKS